MMAPDDDAIISWQLRNRWWTWTIVVPVMAYALVVYVCVGGFAFAWREFRGWLR